MYINTKFSKLDFKYKKDFVNTHAKKKKRQNTNIYVGRFIKLYNNNNKIKKKLKIFSINGLKVIKRPIN